MRMFDPSRVPYQFVFEVLSEHVDKSVIDVSHPWKGDEKNIVTDRISLPIQLRAADVGRKAGVFGDGDIDFESDDQRDIRLGRVAIGEGRTYIEIGESDVNHAYVFLGQSDKAMHNYVIGHLLEHEPQIITQGDVGRRVFFNKSGPLRTVVELASVFKKRKAEAPAKGPSYIEVLPARLKAICDETAKLKAQNMMNRDVIYKHQAEIAKNEDRLRVLSAKALEVLFN